MPDWMDIVNIIVVVSGLTLVLSGLFFAFTLPFLKNPERGYLITVFTLLTFYCLSDLTSQLSLVYFPEGHMIISKIAVFSESLFSSMFHKLRHHLGHILYTSLLYTIYPEHILFHRR